ncbi:RNA polymerase sigma factor [Actinokineospora sp. NPDC004072]
MVRLASGAELSDQVLWSRAVAGDHPAFAELFHRHLKMVWNYAYRLTGSWDVAEDLAAAAFMTAWRRRSEVTLVRESALPWLYTVVGNLARDEARGARRRSRLVRRIPQPPVVADHADAVVDRLHDVDRARELIEAVRRLPGTQRAVVELCLLGELSAGAAAEVLQVSETTVRSALSRARAKLRNMVRE